MGKTPIFSFNSQQTEALDNLRKLLNVSSRGEAIRKSLNLASALATAQSRDYKILVVGPDAKDGDAIELLIK